MTRLPTEKKQSTARCHVMTRAMLRHGHSGQVPRASAQGPALPRGPALQPKFVCYFIQHDHQLQSVGQKCYRLLRRKHNAQTVCLYYVPQQECRTKISHKTSEESVYAPRKLRERDQHGHGFRNTVFYNISGKTWSKTSTCLQATSLYVKNIHTK